jgi:hypothetical protein
MRIFKDRSFHDWVNEIGIDNETLKKAANEISKGLYDASLGGSLYKKRIKYGNRGKSGGVRTVIAFKTNKNMFFMYGFAKNKKATITKKEQYSLKKLGNFYLSCNDIQLANAVRSEILIEVK